MPGRQVRGGKIGLTYGSALRARGRHEVQVIDSVEMPTPD